MAQTLKEHSRREGRQLREAMLDALPRLRRFARSLTGNVHDADDLLQSTVERVLLRPAPDGVDVTRWMLKICRNLWIDEVRARDVRRRAAAPEDVDEPAAADSEAQNALRLREVDRAMARLSEEQRAVIALVAVEGFSYREAAEVLDAPIGTVMSRLSRARAALAAELEKPQPPARDEQREYAND